MQTIFKRLVDMNKVQMAQKIGDHMQNVLCYNSQLNTYGEV